MAPTNGLPKSIKTAFLRAAVGAALCAAGAGATTPALSANLTGGPMAGHRDARSTILWLQGDGKAAAQIEYWAEPAGHRASTRKRSAPVPIRSTTSLARR